MNPAQTQVVGYDGSPLSELSLHRAIRLAAESELPTIHVLMVGEDAGDRVRLPTGAVVSHWEALMSLRLTVKTILRTWDFHGTFVRLVCHVTTGDPAKRILDLAREKSADRILVGADSAGHPRPGSVGAVARAVAGAAPCQVHLETPWMSAPRSQKSDPLRVFLILGDGFGFRYSAQGPKIAAC